MAYRIFTLLLLISLQLQAQEDLEEKWIHEAVQASEPASVAHPLDSSRRASLGYLDSLHVEMAIMDYYHALHPSPDSLDLSYTVFRMGMIGYLNLKAKNKVKHPEYLSLIDFTKPSGEKRFYLIHIPHREIVFHTLVSHGRGTGQDRAMRFSNRPGSFQSSLGFYITAEPYHGKNGFSLRLDGMEKGINDNLRKRAVVIHGADYVSETFIKRYGRLGRSFGCPALPVDLNAKIINLIEGGSVVFAYFRDQNYFETSELLKMTRLIGGQSWFPR
jgi:hypothetical protein